MADHEDHPNAAETPRDVQRTPNLEPAAAPQASRTAPSSGDRGRGGGLGDAVGGQRRGTAAEMLGGDQRVGDVAVEIPRAGSETQGAVQGAGLRQSAVAASAPGADDPGAGTATTGDGGAPMRDVNDASNSGLGSTARGTPLKDFDEVFRRRDE
jgi:hypothetical protein